MPAQIADLEAVRTGHVRHGRTPVLNPRPVVAIVTGAAEVEAGDEASLFRCLNHLPVVGSIVARTIPPSLHVGAVASLEKDLVRRGGLPGSLIDACQHRVA